MALSDLVFIACFLTFVVLLLRLAWLTLRFRWPAARSAALQIVVFAASYTAALAIVSLMTPRRYAEPSERKCFDDWCVAAKTIERQADDSALCREAPAASYTKWLVTMEVSSVAKRIRQRASDASIEVEDSSGARHPPCSTAASPRTLRDELGPGDTFPVAVPFALPKGVSPGGVVVHHGAFPGLIIIGQDQSWLHPPTLRRADVR